MNHLIPLQINVPDNLFDLIISYGLKAIGAILIIIIGFWIANKVARYLGDKLEQRENMSKALANFLKNLIGILLKVLVIIAAIGTVGVETTGFVALLGGVAVGIGMAMQGSLSNFAGGLLILLFKPFELSDVIESLGSTGTVKDISILHTTMITPDRKTVILPNGSVFNNPIINYSKEGIRRVDIGIGIAYSDDFEKAKTLLLEVLKNEPLLIDDLGYTVEIAEFGDSSVNLAMNGYCKTQQYLEALFKLNNATKKALDENGFNIPFPQRDIHIVSQPS